MVLAANELPIYFKEVGETRKTCRFCIKPVAKATPKSEKRDDAVNVQIVKGKTTNFIHLDDEEANKIQKHGDYVLKRLQRIHKSVIWNFVVGRSFADRIQRGKNAAEEISIDHDENSDFDPQNPKTWSDESFSFIGSLLDASEFRYDGYVVLFCVVNDLQDTKTDYDELAWELEKCLTYHYIRSRSQMIMNEEGIMNRKGLGPVSRQKKTPGKKKSGYCIYLAYQLMENVTQDQMTGEVINKCVDLNQKKKQLLSSLAEVKLLPQIDERLRKHIKDIKEVLTKEQLALMLQLKEEKDEANLDMVGQFLTVLKNGKDRTSGMVGLNQFLSFLSKEEPPSSNRSGSRLSTTSSPKTGTGSKVSTLPRPTSSRLPKSSSRKPSLVSQRTNSISSRSSTPDTPRRNGNRDHGRRESSLASIPSSGSASSNPETLRRQAHTASSNTSGSKRHVNPPPTPRNRVDGRPSSSTRSVTPKVSSTRSSINGDSPRLTPTSSPRMTSSAGGKRTRKPPSDGKMITREDLRRMNKSYPSSKKTSSSFSRASIPMS